MNDESKRKRVTTTSLVRMKAEGQRIAMLTGWDYPMTRLMDEAGVDMILVGDSLGMVFAGEKNTLGVTLEQMLYHTRVVSRAAVRALVVSDMPFMSYQITDEEAVRNAGLLVAQGGAHAVKIEGGMQRAETIARVTKAGIPVMAHIGYAPQSEHQHGGKVVQGGDEEAVQKLLADLEAVTEAGAFSVVLETIRWPVAQKLTENSTIPTIGIGAGPYCDGQILVTADILGLFSRFRPRFVKQYADLGAQAARAFDDYIREVREGKFPDLDHSYGPKEGS